MDTRMLVFDRRSGNDSHPITINDRQSIDTIGELLDAQLPKPLSPPVEVHRHPRSIRRYPPFPTIAGCAELVSADNYPS